MLRIKHFISLISTIYEIKPVYSFSPDSSLTREGYYHHFAGEERKEGNLFKVTEQLRSLDLNPRSLQPFINRGQNKRRRRVLGGRVNVYQLSSECLNMAELCRGGKAWLLARL